LPIILGNERSNWELQGKLQTVAPEQVRNEEETEQKQSRMLIETGKFLNFLQ
jgi:hypothetical protein